MKNVKFLLPFTFLLLNVSCKKKNGNEKEVTVLQNCVGTFIRHEDQTYRVCNFSALSAFSHGSKATLNWTSLNECNVFSGDSAVCLLYVPNEGWVEVHDAK